MKVLRTSVPVSTIIVAVQVNNVENAGIQVWLKKLMVVE